MANTNKEYKFSFAGYMNERDAKHVIEFKNNKGDVKKVRYSGSLVLVDKVSKAKREAYAKALLEGTPIYISFTECDSKYDNDSYQMSLGSIG